MSIDSLLNDPIRIANAEKQIRANRKHGLNNIVKQHFSRNLGYTENDFNELSFLFRNLAATQGFNESEYTLSFVDNHPLLTWNDEILN